jgi:hypothetical protein
MSSTPLDVADTVVPELKLAVAEVQLAFDELTRARSKFNRCSKPASREAARLAMVQAEAAYRVASDRRDQLVELRNARLTQKGDERGALWSRPDGVTAPVVAAVERCWCGVTIDRGNQCCRAGHHVYEDDGVTPLSTQTPAVVPTITMKTDMDGKPWPKVKITRAGGYDPKLGPKHPDNQDPTLEQSPAQRIANAVWLRMQIQSLANDAAANAKEDAKNAEESGSDERDKYVARADTAKHYASELRRILRGLTWDEDFADRVVKSDPKLARKIARLR